MGQIYCLLPLFSSTIKFGFPWWFFHDRSLLYCICVLLSINVCTFVLIVRLLMLAFDWCVSGGVCSCTHARRSSSSSTTTAWPATRAPSQRSTLDTRTRMAFSTSSTPRRKHSAPSDNVRQVLHRTWTSKLLMLTRGDIRHLDSSSYTEHGCLNIWGYGQHPSRTKPPKLTKPSKWTRPLYFIFCHFF